MLLGLVAGLAVVTLLERTTHPRADSLAGGSPVEQLPAAPGAAPGARHVGASHAKRAGDREARRAAASARPRTRATQPTLRRAPSSAGVPPMAQAELAPREAHVEPPASAGPQTVAPAGADAAALAARGIGTEFGFER
jgi:hypothetical protein